MLKSKLFHMSYEAIGTRPFNRQSSNNGTSLPSVLLLQVTPQTQRETITLSIAFRVQLRCKDHES